MESPLFDDFLTSDDTLRVYERNRLVFSSNKDRLQPLLEYIGQFSTYHKGVTIFDKIMGNAAALLCVRAGAGKVCSPFGSRLAVKTLDEHRIAYRIVEIVPHIAGPDGRGMCPMEKLSIGKDPDEFYDVMKPLR